MQFTDNHYGLLNSYILFLLLWHSTLLFLYSYLVLRAGQTVISSQFVTSNSAMIMSVIVCVCVGGGERISGLFVAHGVTNQLLMP
jgi:hypothetical protein